MTTCSTCRHGHSDLQSLQLFCRRYPPTAAIIPFPRPGPDGQVQIHTQVQSAFPPVQPKQNCGEWAPDIKLTS